MRLFYPIFAALLFMPPAFAATRDSASSAAASRQQPGQARSAAANAAASPRQQPGQTRSGESRNVSAASAQAAARQTQARSAASRTVAAASNLTATARAALASRAAVPATTQNITGTGAAVSAQASTSASAKRTLISRAAAPIATQTQLLGDGYVVCRDAYFACMDQFCALRNEQYRRCTCSARLSEMRERERNFSTATGMLKDFETHNLNVVDKSAAEVKAMYNAAEGEAAIKKDTSASAKALSGIGDVLSGKSLDSAENMRNMADIWGTVDLVGGADVATLESTALYNAVHMQCAEMVAESCERAATFNMVSAAYGMYIEQDCSAYADSLDKQQRTMITVARQAQGALAAARLDNYDAHNSAEISECLANVRNDMFGAAGCGPDNIGCIDYTGRFINATTGEPIYSSDFYMLEKAISLDDKILQNNTNVPYINMLNSKKNAAVKSLDKCRDISDFVWEEYLRQTLVDLSQRQFAKVRDVRNNCVRVVNECYDDKLEQLRQFASDISQENVAAQQIGLTETLCQEQLNTCAILYDGGPPGLQKLLDYVRNTQTVKLEGTCEKYLTSYIENTCTPINDNVRGFPYQCRFTDPGTWVPPGATDNATLIGRLRVKAKEVCVRSDVDRNDPNSLSNEVEMIINKIMDDVKLKMDGILTIECKKISDAVWHTRVLGTYDKGGSIEGFEASVGSHDGWGACRNKDMAQCPANSTWNIDAIHKPSQGESEVYPVPGAAGTKGIPVKHCRCDNEGETTGEGCP